MTGIQIVQQIVEILVSGIAGLGQGIGAGINTFITSLAMTGTGNEQTLSVFLIFVAVFASLALAVGLTRHVFSWIESLSGSR